MKLNKLVKKGIATIEERKMINKHRDNIEAAFNAFCKAYNLKGINLVLVGDVTWNLYLDRKDIEGHYRHSDKELVVKVNEKNMRDVYDTLFHELTHAYQFKYHMGLVKHGFLQQQAYKNSPAAYTYSVHEQHARLCAIDIYKIYRQCKGDMNMFCRSLKAYRMEDAFYSINTMEYAI